MANHPYRWISGAFSLVASGRFISIGCFPCPVKSEAESHLLSSAGLCVAFVYSGDSSIRQHPLSFTLNYTRLLAIILLLGIVTKAGAKAKLFTVKSDWYVVLFVLFICYSAFRDNTVTNALRTSLLHVIDIFVPYYVLSRFLDSKEQLNRAIFALLICISPFALVGIFETVKHWHVFNTMKQGLTGARGNLYDIREGALRASAIFGTPIVLGYVMVIGFGLLLYLRPLIKNTRLTTLAGLGFVAALLSTMARGPWVGFVCLCFAFMWTGRGGIKKIASWSLAGVLSLPVLAQTSVGSKFIDLLPFIGNARSDTIEYRTRLIQQSWIVFKRHPWTGSTTFLDTPEMESMRQGQGLIDLVNTFIAIGLPYGIVGLFLFMAIFLGLMWRCFFILNRIPRSEDELILMGRTLFAILASILLMISTVSPIDYIPVLYWTFTGITAAYLNVTEKTINQIRTAKWSIEATP
ncbi:MAG: O-antigen ligase family protein [Methylococcaceae bacterium]|nr:O-antigen ligase family protein [Methylococcaceae bacterium]